MASVPRPRRHRSSTTRSNAPPSDSQTLTLEILLGQINPGQSVEHNQGVLLQLNQVFDDVVDREAIQDHFRRLHGFESLITILRDLGASSRSGSVSSDGKQAVSSLFCTALQVFVRTFKNHEGNLRYFNKRIARQGWSVIHELSAQIVQDLDASIVNEEVTKRIDSLAECLLSLAITDESVLGSFQGSSELLNSDTESAPDQNDEAVQQESTGTARPVSRLPVEFTIVVADALPSLADLYVSSARSRTDDSQKRATKLLDVFDAIARSSFYNRTRLSGANIVQALMALLFEQVLPARDQQKLQILCIALLQAGVDSLESTAFLLQSATRNEIARCLLLETSARPKQAPSIHFDMSHHGHSSIEIADFPRVFPPAGGYSWSAWVNFEKIDDRFHTTIFGVQDPSSTSFLLIYLEQNSHCLILQTSVTAPNPSVRFRRTQFHENRWYHIVLVHRPSKQGPNGEALLYVDGHYAEKKEQCLYPQAPPPVSGGSNSSPFPPEPRNRQPIQAFYGTPQRFAIIDAQPPVSTMWSLTNAHMYDVCLSKDMIAVHAALGPHYAGNYQDIVGPWLTYRAAADVNRLNQELYHDHAADSAIARVINSRGMDLMHEGSNLISISPQTRTSVDGILADNISLESLLNKRSVHQLHVLTRSGNPILFNAARVNIGDALLRPDGNAFLMGKAYASIPRTLDDTLWQVGGFLGSGIRMIETAKDGTALKEVIQILFNCIESNWRLSEVMEVNHGYGLVALTLREKIGVFHSSSVFASTRNSLFIRPTQERADLIQTLLPIVLQFLGIDMERPRSSVMLNPMAYRALLLDMDTWRVGTIESQKTYYEQFTWLLDSNKNADYNAKRLSKARIIRVLLNSFKVEGVFVENIPFVLTAFEVVFTKLAIKSEPRDLANFIGYALHDARTSEIPLQSRGSAIRSHASVRKPSSTSISSNFETSKLYTVAAPKAPIEALGIAVLEQYAKMLSDKDSPGQFKKFVRYVPIRWLLHLLSEPNSKAIAAVMRIIVRAMGSPGLDFRTGFEKNAGFPILRHQLKAHWQSPYVWLCCFSLLFGQDVSEVEPPDRLTTSELVSIFLGEKPQVVVPEIIPCLTSLLETSLKVVTSETSSNVSSSASTIPMVVIDFLRELHLQSPAFRDFAASSQYVQELIFTLYYVIADTDQLSAAEELSSSGETLTSERHNTVLHAHKNPASSRPKMSRAGSSTTLPENNRPPRIQAPRRTSSFVFVDNNNGPQPHLSAHFDTNPAKAKDSEIPMRIENKVLQALLELIVDNLVDQVCSKKDFAGFGLFLKVPASSQEHRAFFQSYVLLHIMTALWTHLQLHQSLMQSPRSLTNLSKFCQHVSEAVFEGWFIDGSQPLLDFVGNLLDHLQQPEIAIMKDVRLCSQATMMMRSVFLRVTLWRLSELDETESDDITIEFLRKLTYWQTILFSPDNQELGLIRLLCYVFYTKLRSSSAAVRRATASLFRMLLVLKPTEAATMLVHNAESDLRHLSTGLMRLATHDDEELLRWIEDRSALLDRFFLEVLGKYWQEFVANESQRTEETRDNRLAKRREKLRHWQSEEKDIDHVLRHYEHNTCHWRINSHAQERLKLQRAAQDQQESIEHLRAAASRLNDVLHQPNGLFADIGAPKWQLDPTESRNRMRVRLLRDAARNSDLYQAKRKVSERIDLDRLTVSRGGHGTSEQPASPHSPSHPDIQRGIGDRKVSDEVDAENGDNPNMSSSSLLEGEFELVDDPKEEDETFDDKNRKILRSVRPGDQIKHIYNASRIVGLEACEGLLIVGKKNLYIQDNMFHRSDGEIVSIAQAPVEERDDYIQLISGREIKAPRWQQRQTADLAKHWSWTDLLSLSRRRFLFRDVAIEVFFNDGQSYLLIFKTPSIRNDVYSNMVSRAPHVHSSISSLPEEDAWRVECLRIPEEIPQSIGSKFANVFNTSATNTATRKWMKGEISNFHYLMLINTMAGRTFNDLTQYPVFPWVLADYTSNQLDLSDPKIFRDLSKPMGCQSPQRESDFRERYQSFAEMGEENPFHYGTHYSSAMIVTSYLIRMQPFVQSYLLLQGGTFDHPDRLFDSIERAWVSASKQIPTDVRELTPEFYYLPEFLQNLNGYEFGAKQGGEVIDNVQLPRWAKGDPYLFIAKHREALESPYVSQHLHEWIDLVFGYKQRGDAAVEATNVFHPLSYHGAKNLDTINDPVERLAAIGFIHNFGQTPHQVFQRPHPKREHDKYDTLRLDSLADTLTRLPDPVMETGDRVASLFWSANSDRLITAASCKLNVPPHGKAHAQWLFADNSLRFFHNSSKKLLALHEQFHIGPITTVAFADAKTLLTGGADSTIGVWDFSSPSSDEIKIKPKTYLFGHRAPVSVLVASWAFSTLVSASTDGQVIVWDMNRFDCLRILLARSDTGITVSAAQINNVTGHILLCIGASVSLYTLNGHLLLAQRVCDAADEDVLCAAFYEGVGNEWVTCELVFTGHRRGVVKVWKVVTLDDGAWCLQLIKHLSHGEQVPGTPTAGITSVLALERTVYAGDEAGRVWQWDCVVRQSRR